MKEKHLFAIVACLLTLSAMAYSLQFAVNIPHLDDYDQVLQFLVNFDNANGLWERIQIVFSERNEHRTGVYHMVSLFDYLLFGKVNFIHLIVVIHLFFGASIYLLYLIFSQIKQPNLYFVPILLLVAVPCAAFLNWTSAGLVYVPTVFFSLCTLLALSRTTKSSFLLAVLASVMTVASSGAGLILYIAAIPFFIGHRSRKEGLIWIVVFATMILAYFIGYHPEKSGNPLLSALTNPLIVLANFAVFYGALFTAVFKDYYIWNILFGGALLTLASYLIYRHRRQIKSNPLLVSGLLLAIGLGATTSLMRSYMGLGVTSAERYRLFQTLLPVFLYLWALNEGYIKKQTLYWLVGLSVFIFGMRWEYNSNRLKNLNQRLAYGMYAYQITDDAKYLPVKKPKPEKALLDVVREHGIYDPHRVHIELPVKTELVRRVDPQQSRVIKGKEDENDDYYTLQGWAFMKYSPNLNLDIWIKMESETSVYYLPTGPYFFPRSLIENSESGFTFILDKHRQDIPAGNYDLSVVLTQPIKGIVGAQVLRKSVTIN